MGVQFDRGELIRRALEQQKNAYAPYSGYCVGAAVLMDSGKIYTGVNVENSSYPAGICAERNAIFHAAACGERKIIAIAIAGPVIAVARPPTVYSAPPMVQTGLVRKPMWNCVPSVLMIVPISSEQKSPCAIAESASMP